MNPQDCDPVIDEVREVRQRISARFNHDPERLVAYSIELQKRHQLRLIDPSQTPDRGKNGVGSEWR